MGQLFNDWQLRQATAEAMIPLIGKLYRDSHVVTSIYGRSIINRSVIEIIKAHRFVQKVEQTELSVKDTFPILKILSELNLAPARIDIGKLAMSYKNQAVGTDLNTFIKQQSLSIVDSGRPHTAVGTDVILYGFGRIGRLLARILIERSGVVARV